MLGVTYSCCSAAAAASGRSTWFVLGVLAALLGLPDARVIVMLAGRALLLPASVVLVMLAPAATFVAVISTAAAGLTRPRVE